MNGNQIERIRFDTLLELNDLIMFRSAFDAESAMSQATDYIGLM